MTGTLHGVALGLYAVATVILTASLLRPRGDWTPAATGTVAGAALLHLLALAGYVLRYGELPLTGLGPVLSVLALLVTLGSLWAALGWKAGTVGLVLVPVSLLLLGVALAAGVSPPVADTAFGGPGFALHVTLAFAGYAGLTVGSAAGLMYLLQFRQLKGKRFGAVFRFFPPLETLHRLGGRALALGFPLFTLSLLVGWAWMVGERGSLEFRNPHVIWGVLTWFVFGVILLLRTGRREHRAALASVLGFALVVASYLLLRVPFARGGMFL
ncbi:MAG: cytochrome c biogenesis protein CcsA [Longimicrobiaceae bacterium]